MLGRGVLDHLAPEVADEAEYQRLVAEEGRAHAATRLSFRPRGDGSTDIHARIPDHVANRLRTYLDAYTSPRRTPLGDVDQLPVARGRGEAFCALLENLLDTGLPTHGGTATSVMVTIDIDTLIQGLGVAEMSTTNRPGAANRPTPNLPTRAVTSGRRRGHVRGSASGRDPSPAQRILHHHRAHDPARITHHHPNGATTFTRHQ